MLVDVTAAGPSPVAMDGRTYRQATCAIGLMLRAARHNKRMTLVQLATLCQTSPSVVCRVELGRRPTFELLFSLCAHLDLRLSHVIQTIEDGAEPMSGLASLAN